LRSNGVPAKTFSDSANDNSLAVSRREEMGEKQRAERSPPGRAPSGYLFRPGCAAENMPFVSTRIPKLDRTVGRRLLSMSKVESHGKELIKKLIR
jgi:hypothetical protein